MKEPFVKKLFVLFFLFVLFPVILAKDKPTKEKDGKNAVPKTAEEKAAEEAARQFEAQLDYQRGEIKLKDGLATLVVPEGFRYLNPQQARKILEEAWGNPPGEETLGMLFPSGVSPLSENGWGVVITYEEEGYVKDDEAESINYDDLLKQMKEDTSAANAERQKAGYERIELAGWATRPYYDKSSHKLYWAKELRFGDNPENTLNYNIRALGRRGVLVLNAVASVKQLSAIQEDMKQVLGFVTFNEGHRYSDFNPQYDKVAAYGIGALIAGKVAAKAGLFKILIGLLAAGKKFIIIALVGAGALIKKLLGRKSEPENTAAE